jgi:hypothetical protein
MNAGEFSGKLIQSARAISAAEDEYRGAIERWATAERLYKRRQAIATTNVTEFRNAADREAQVELLPFEDKQTVGDLRYEAHLAENMMNACKLALQARMQELSALQSYASLAKEEARFDRTAPSEVMGP